MNSAAPPPAKPEQAHGTLHPTPTGHMKAMSIPRPPKPGQSLADKFPDIAAQWHLTRNGDLTPDQVSAGSEKRVWWSCDLGHEWETKVKNRTRQGDGCPVCTGRKVLAGYNDLATRFPDIAKQWHPTRNGELIPDQVSAGSEKRVWWRCEQGHEWEATVGSRTRQGNGCPVHAGRKPLAGCNDLATRFPDIAAQWHPTRNGDLTPGQVYAGSRKRVWWRCEQGHEWETKVGSRTSGGSGCPVHAGRKPLAGSNDLATTFPDIAAQWHPTRNGYLTPDQVSAGSSKKMWWRCEQGHAWEATVGSRTTGGCGCPVHSGKKLLAGYNDLATKNPAIAAQWHPTKNGDCTPDQVLAGTNAKVWWRCEQGHAWEATVSRRTRQSTGCPVCTGRKVLTASNELATRFPAVAAQWHPTRNGDLRPDQVSAGSNEKVWWRCDLGHEWKAVVSSRTTGGNGCPVHSGRKVLAGYNDLATWFPDLAAQWHPTRNGDLRPDQVSMGSEKRVWWRCEQGHAWEAKVSSRTSGGHGCPVCTGRSVLAGHNDLATTVPDLAAQWHPTRNGDLRPDQVSMGSEKRVWWRCEQGHEWEAKVSSRTSRGHGCFTCNNGYTLATMIALIRSMGPHGQGMGAAERFQIAAQAGVLSGTHGKTARELIASGILPPEYGTDKDTATGKGTDPDGTGAATEQPDTDGADEGEEIRVLAPGADIATGSDEDVERAKIAVLAVPEALAVPEQLFANASTDTETLKFLIAARVAKIWKAAYAEDRGEVIPAGGQSVAEMTAELQDGTYAEMVRGTFRAEYDAAQNLTPPAGWSFRPGSTPNATEPVAPNLMQRHVATLLRDRSRVGNWSGTGSGKTVSAVLGARLIDAGTTHDGGKPGVVVVLCPNNTVPGWESVIASCYPDNQVITKTLRPAMADWSGAGPRWLVVNFDRLQQDTSQPDLSALLASYQVDLLVVDEVHLIKHRASKVEESRRRLAIKGLSCEAGRLNPALSVLTMSATPVVNDLHEARSLLEVLWGVNLDDVKVTRTDTNAFNIHALLVRAGVRWMPKYTPKMSEHTPQINVDHLLEPLRGLGRSPNAAAVERTLIDAKLPTIVDECVAAQQQGRRTLVYTHFVHELVAPIQRALEAVGLRVGVFTGVDKSGLAAFLGKDTTGATVRTMAENERVDVLIGSSAIGTGVDGLQDVADTLIFASLPWTNAEWRQIVGRLHRQGQPHNVDVITPTTWLEHDDHNAEGRMDRWSWDEYRMQVVKYKKSLADTAVDGVAPAGQIIDPDGQARHLLGWLHRVETDGVATIVRTPLDATLETLVAGGVGGDEVQRRRHIGDFSQANRRWNQTGSGKTHARLTANPTEWRDYHALYTEARRNWATIPAHVFADWLDHRLDRPRRVADLGCGEMLLADRLIDSGNPGGHIVLGFDHVAVDERVAACDIAHLPLPDASVEVAVLSLALMGANHGDYITEAHRVLGIDGQLWIAETASRVGQDTDRLRNSMRDYGFDLAHIEVVTDTFTMIRATRADRAPIADPRPFLFTVDDAAASDAA